MADGLSFSLLITFLILQLLNFDITGSEGSFAGIHGGAGGGTGLMVTPWTWPRSATSKDGAKLR